MSLLHRLLGFARGDEDPITETLAWFLGVSGPHRDRVLRALDDVLRARGAALPRGGDARIVEPAIATQLTVPDPGGGSCRYDLVLDWHDPRVRLIVEVKVWAGLTWKTETDPGTQEQEAVHQLTRYLRVAASTPDVRTHIFILAPYVIEPSLPEPSPVAFAGQLTWQTVHDAFADVASSRALDGTMLLLTRDFIHTLETRHMAAPRLTFDGITSVYRYRRFEQSLTAMLTHARDALFDDGTLGPLVKGDRRAWQDAHDRLGWRMWVNASQAGYFAFLGIYWGQETIHEEVPDLYFFLEVPRGTAAQEALDAKQADIVRRIESLSTQTTRWYFYPGGYETIGACRSLVEIARLPDPTDAMTQFFRECVNALKNNGIYEEFLVLGPK